MSSHPMCKECIARPVCGTKYGQIACIKVHGLITQYGRVIANSAQGEPKPLPTTKVKTPADTPAQEEISALITELKNREWRSVCDGNYVESWLQDVQKRLLT